MRRSSEKPPGFARFHGLHFGCQSESHWKDWHGRRRRHGLPQRGHGLGLAPLLQVRQRDASGRGGRSALHRAGPALDRDQALWLAQRTDLDLPQRGADQDGRRARRPGDPVDEHHNAHHPDRGRLGDLGTLAAVPGKPHRSHDQAGRGPLLRRPCPSPCRRSLVPAGGDAAKVASVTALAAGRSTRAPQAVPVTPHIRKYHPVTLATDELAVAKAGA